MARTITSNSGTVKLTNPGDNPLTINAGVTVSGGYYAVYATFNQAWSIVNQGTLLGKYGVYLNDANSGQGSVLTNSGTASDITGSKTGVLAFGSNSTIINQGSITGTSAYGIDLTASGEVVTNSGTGAVIHGGEHGVYAGSTPAVITNSGAITGGIGHGVFLEAGGTITNSGTGARIVGGSDGISVTGSAAMISNSGTINGSFGDGVGLAAGGTVTNSGTAAAINGNSDGVYATNSAVAVINAGTITGVDLDGVYLKAGGQVTNSSTAALISGGGAYGIRIIGGTGGVTNQGTVSNAGAAVDLLGGGTLANNGTAAQILGGNWGVYFGASGGAADVVNQGTISGTIDVGINLGAGGTLTNKGSNALIYGQSFGVYAFNQLLTLVNEGSISANSGVGVYLDGGGTVTNSSSAQIGGATSGIVANINPIGVVNAGTILGTTASGVYLKAGGTVTNVGTAAVIAGELYGIKVHGAIATVINQGTVSGATAAVQFANFSGNVLQLYPGAVTHGVVRGGTGSDTLELGASGAVVGTISGISTQYTGFEAFDVDAGALWQMTGNNTVAAFATLSLGASALLTVSGSLVSLGKLTLEGSGTIATSGAGAIEVGTAGSATSGEFLIDGGRTMVTTGSVSLKNVLNRGVVSGLSNYGLYLGGGGTVTNGATTARISGQDDGIAAKGAARIHNAGTITGTSGSGVYLGAGGSVTNTGTGAVISGNYGIKAEGNAAAVANFGSIISTSFVGVYLGAGGSVTNASTASVIYGQNYGVDIRNDPANITNLGTIASPFQWGVYLGAGGSVTNSGTAALISSGIGVAAGTLAAVTNQGTITGSEAGVYLKAGGTVIDSGTISGPVNAVLIGGGTDSRLVVDPGAVFSGGDVDGGNAVDATAVSTLELNTGSGAGTLHGLGSHYVNFAQTTIDAGASWTLTGYNSLAAGATLTNSGTLALSSATLTDSGVLTNNGKITLDPSTLIVGSLLGTGGVTIDASGTLEAQGTVASGETIAFGGSGAYLHLDTPGDVSGSVTNFTVDESIDLKGVAAASVDLAAGTLSFAGGSFALSLTGATGVTAVSSADGALVSALCFCAGTMILTPAGEVPVEDLSVGDRVVTASGVVETLVWIGTGQVMVTRGRRSPATPVIVRKSALADNVPNRDLRITKGHSLLLDGVLIPVEFLVNNRSIQWDDHAQEVTIYHLEIAAHDVLVANGAAAESYRDDGNRWLFRNANSGWHLPAQEPCAPVLTGGAIVDAAWLRLLERAGARPGLPLTDEPDLHLLVDGLRVDPVGRRDGAYEFQLGAQQQYVRIRSRSAVPLELGTARDARVLGVAIRRIVLTQGRQCRVVNADAASLSDGFHAFEAEDGLRWTDGDAAVPTEMFAGMQGPHMLTLHLGCTTRYLDDGVTVRAA